MPRVLSTPWWPWWLIHVSPRTCRPNPPSHSLLFQLYREYVLPAGILKAWVAVRRPMIGRPESMLTRGLAVLRLAVREAAALSLAYVKAPEPGTIDTLLHGLLDGSPEETYFRPDVVNAGYRQASP